MTAAVGVGRAPDGIAVDTKTNTIYVASDSDGTVSVISGRTNTVTATIGVGLPPWAITVKPKTNAVYVSGGDAVAVLDSCKK